MIRRLHSRRIVCPDGIRDGFVYTDGGRIAAVTGDMLPCDEERELGEQLLCPGLIDLHVHGAAGFDFGSSDARGIAAAAEYHLHHGTTALLPTLTSSTPEALCRALEALRECRESCLTRAQLLGAHLEGPYFSPAQCGAQDPVLITAPIPADYERILQRYGDQIARWSYAPERDAGEAFCRTLVRCGILPSAGHTDATGDDMARAFAAGCRLVTHLYSCTSTVTRDHGFRRLGVIEYAFLNREMDVEIIADGAHLPPELIRMIVGIKGAEHTALVTDALSLTGTDRTEASVGSVPCLLEDGVCKLQDRSAFAGSIATADRLVRVCVQQAGLPLTQAVAMASATPARILGLPRKGRIEPGCDADFAVMNDRLEVTGVWVDGEPV